MARRLSARQGDKGIVEIARRLTRYSAAVFVCLKGRS